jgi:uncharacterized protein YqgC (DUF456 family)
MTMIPALLILTVALVASGCMHYPVHGTLAMFLLIILALGLGFDWHDQSAEEIRHCDNARGYKDNHNK